MYASFLKNIILPLGDLVFNGNYVKTLKEWNDYDSLSESELLRIQTTELEQTLKYTIEKVPFYKEMRYDESLSPTENLKRFPVLTKETLRKHAESLVSDEFDIKNLRKNFSSGSSGIQSYSYSEKKNVFYLQGLSYHWYMWGGFEIGKPVLQFGISPKRTLPKKLKDLFFRTNYEEAFALNERSEEHTSELQSRPHLVCRLLL